MKLSALLMAAVCAASVFAAIPKDGKIAQIYNEKFGGFVTQPGSLKGSIGFLNAQTRVDAAEIDHVIAAWKKLLQHTMINKSVPSMKGMPTRTDVEKAGVTVAIYAVDDATLPSLLVAPEDRWALVNVARLNVGLKDNAVGKAILKTRFRAELMRAFALVCGGASSQFGGNVYTAVEIPQLDSLNSDALQVDMAQRIGEYLKNLGVTPARTVTYVRACQEGWAPAPTNDYQRAAAQKVQARKAAGK